MLLLFATTTLFFSTSANGQGCPAPPPCGNMWLEMVRVSPNVLTGCDPSSDLTCGDKFRQLSYKVYLRITRPGPLADFNLDYSNLNVIVNLNQNPPGQYSHIDVEATTQCFNSGIGAKWFNYNNGNGDKVIFTPSDTSVSISFANLAPTSSGGTNCGTAGPNNTSNMITFTQGTPPNADGCPQGGPNQQCFYAELFTVVVNAYPGEFIGFQFDLNGRWYEPKSVSGPCTLPTPTTGPNNGQSTTTVGFPGTFVGTPNENIEVQLLAHEPTADGGSDFPVAVKNTGTVIRVVTYLEFVLKATVVNLTEPFTYPIGVVPQEGIVSTNPVTGETTRYLYYRINTSITLNPGETSILSKIRIGPPTLLNLNWSANLDFEGAATKSRVKTSGVAEACTRLKTSGGPVSYINNVSNSFCSDPSIRFKVKGVSGNCGDLRASIELSTTNSPATIQLERLEFSVKFDFDSPDISIIGVAYPDWPNIICASSTCYPGAPCYTISPDGKTFNYCFQVPSNAPTIFTLDPSAAMEIIFSSTGKGCITKATVTKLAITYATALAPCIPGVGGAEGFSLCANSIKGIVRAETGEGIEEVAIVLNGAVVNLLSSDSIVNCASVTCSAPCGTKTDLTDTNGAYSFCDVCLSCDRFMLAPEKDDNPLNGVTTYDLVLINKHILAIDPLIGPFKIIAADANKSGSITTFDIVELRKLILGTYTVLPKTKSWRFIAKSFVFPNAENPFQTAFEQVENCIAPQSGSVDFIGIKVGDVNNTAVPGRPAPRPVVALSWPSPRSQPGTIITLPITYQGNEAMEALQMGIRFDPTVLQLISPSKGDIESYLPDNFNLLKAAQGEIRTLWLPMTGEPEPVLPGTVLFYLTFKVLSEVSETGLPLWLDEGLLTCSAWKSDGTECALQYISATQTREESANIPGSLQASVRPNPTGGIATLFVQVIKPEMARVMLFDAFGRRLAMRELQLSEGRQEIPLPEVQGLPTGVYVWKIYTPSQKAQGHLVKQ